MALPGYIPADEVAPRGTKEWRQAVVRNRGLVGNALWQAQARERLNLSDPEALSAYLAKLGFTDEVGGGRHMRNLFLGNLGSEGFGMSSPERGISYALEAYMPDWKRWHDRDLQRGRTRVQAEANFPWAQGNTLGDLAAPEPFNSAATFNPVSTDTSKSAFAPMDDPLRRRRTLGTL
jgi:hypothetical protein